ncbi:MAG: 3D domain-containing protein [Alphaproteobacteria bacterium]|nr:3D domain-containing protein [Alphaproteobacteria bacterium]
MRYTIFFIAVLSSFSDLGIAHSSDHCDFDGVTMSFKGTPSEQARCLLTPVGKYAHLGETLSQLPPTLAALLGTDVELSASKLDSYREAHGFEAAQLGGDLFSPLSRARTNDHNAPQARYLVIHDTSWPYYGDHPFPDNVNSDAYVNDLDRYQRPPGKEKAHVYINREGAVYNQLDFSVPWRATKLEIDEIGTDSRGLFLHVELVQPRRRDPQGGAKNDAIAPKPGFSESQYRWLALLYVSASVRRGDWIIPAYHAVMDNHLPDGHDDPQNFDLAAFDTALDALLNDIQIFSHGLGDQHPVLSLRTTNYYVAMHSEYPAGSDAAFLAPDGTILARVSRAFLEGAQIEGSAKLADGRVLNYHSKVGGEIRWSEVGSAYGLGRGACPLAPMRAVAVDPEVVPLNSLLEIEETIGMPLGDGNLHDGRWYAIDGGSAIQDDRIDLFTGLGKVSMQRVYDHGIKHLQPLTVRIIQEDGDCPFGG